MLVPLHFQQAIKKINCIKKNNKLGMFLKKDVLFVNI